MRDVNAVITKADVRFFPELSANQIELTLDYNFGRALFRAPMNTSNMFALFDMFHKDSIEELRGQYCRVLMDEATGRVDSIRNIVYDDRGELQDNPVA